MRATGCLPRRLMTGCYEHRSLELVVCLGREVIGEESEVTGLDPGNPVGQCRSMTLLLRVQEILKVLLSSITPGHLT